MNRQRGHYRTEIRREMRGGTGQVGIEHLWEPAKEMLAPNRMAAKLTLEPGSSIGFHRHEDEEELFYIISGRAQADDNGVTVELEAGDTLLTGNGAGHSIRNIGEDALEILAVITRY